jgi:hypothetical protein
MTGSMAARRLNSRLICGVTRRRADHLGRGVMVLAQAERPLANAEKLAAVIADPVVREELGFRSI